MQCGIPVRRFSELLGARVKLLVAALDQHYIEALIGYFDRDRDARPRPRPRLDPPTARNRPVEHGLR